MKYFGENAIKKLISLIKSDLATKQPTITASGLLKGDGAGTVTAAVKGTDYWTSADKQEIVQDVLAALPVMKGGSY